MPDKLCRSCGGDLIKWSACTECRKITQRICGTCNLKTLEDLHFHHLSIIPYSILETKNTRATVQSYYDVTVVKKPQKSRRDKSRLSEMLVVSGIVLGMIVLGMSGMTYMKDRKSVV